jgi:hypothetical protein
MRYSEAQKKQWAKLAAEADARAAKAQRLAHTAREMHGDNAAAAILDDDLLTEIVARAGVRPPSDQTRQMAARTAAHLTELANQVIDDPFAGLGG